jgi:hypothetical protein
VQRPGDRLTAHIIETGTESYRLLSTTNERAWPGIEEARSRN